MQQDSKSGFAARYCGSEPLTPSLLQQCVEQAKTLLLAGQDTTSCALQWCFFYLWKNPDVLKKLRDEHDAVFGENCGGLSALIRQNPQVLQDLTYTTAVIKETLRLRGISGTTRELATNTVVEVDGESMLVEAGAILYVNNFLLMKNHQVSISITQTNERSQAYSDNFMSQYWGHNAETFYPERFLNNGQACHNGDSPARELRNVAYRPFERGPRSCIAQEFVMLEMRIVLLLTVSRFDFVKKGYDGVSEEEVYDISRVVHSPIDRMKMRFMKRVVAKN